MGALDDIDQIENLNLPKRIERRRTIYVGEEIRAKIETKTHKLNMWVVDMSFRGVALVDSITTKTKSIKTGDSVKIDMDQFSMEGFITHITYVHFSEIPYLRFGVKFQMEIFDSIPSFHEKITPQPFPCKGVIKPQAYCLDPFFFNETILFGIHSFTPKGVELEVSARCKSILPGQKLDLVISMPGRGSYEVSITTDIIFFVPRNESRIRFYGKFITPPKSFLEAISEYILMFSQKTHLEELKNKGFALGNLSHALDLSFDQTTPNPQSLNLLYTHTLLGMPRKEKVTIPHARNISCHLGQEIVAKAMLVFVDDSKNNPSILNSYGYSIPSSKHLELIHLHILKGVQLTDFLMFFLIHIIRIGAQSSLETLFLEAQDPLWPILQRMGFRPLPIKNLYSISIPGVLLNQKKEVTPIIWDKIYKNLYRYLQKNPNFPKK